MMLYDLLDLPFQQLFFVLCCIWGGYLQAWTGSKVQWFRWKEALKFPLVAHFMLLISSQVATSYDLQFAKC